MSDENTETAEPKFEYINLEEESDGSTADVEDEQTDVLKTKVVKKKKLKKKKKIYFRSDFTGDKDSSSDDDDSSSSGQKKKVGICAMDPHDLTWTMWVWYYVVFASSSTFHAAEFCGEKLADFFGITSPKYQYVIDEYHRLKQEEQEEEEAEQRAVEFLRQEQLKKIQQLEDGGDKQQTAAVIDTAPPPISQDT